ncbi:Golgi phosphoprotein 3 (GPP34) [Corynebacterium uterequi]|uniref:Golgi phosphoprotein 3 (GPP34) n=2 Tax=Corynebacterium uterequi TaxID=1072256 RepID=A0A0G3HIP9_9CORY|nr:Golgi phosphoprotein 3 (GPP34) [Corynebacterium uterequi]
MLISEKLLLLLTPESGKNRYSNTHLVLASGVLADLLYRGLVTLSDGRLPKVTAVADAEVPDSPMLAQALDHLRSRGSMRAQHFVTSRQCSDRELIAEPLVQRGILTRGEKGFFGLGSRALPEADGSIEAQLRRDLAEGLSGHRVLSAEDATVLAVLRAGNLLWPVMRNDVDDSVTWRSIGKRVDSLMSAAAADPSASDALRATLAAAAAVAALAATTAATTATS